MQQFSFNFQKMVRIVVLFGAPCIFQNIGHFSFPNKFIVFVMYLDVYVQIQSESYEFRKVKTTYILDWKEYIFTVVTLLCRLMLFCLF